jgi:hypothetical protein
MGYSMPNNQSENKATTSAADIERSIQALNKMAERLWGTGEKPRQKRF